MRYALGIVVEAVVIVVALWAAVSWTLIVLAEAQ